MCGLAGVFGYENRQAMTEVVGAMADSLYHRGPDGNGVWVDADANIALGHSRLAILDLSQEGHQPMTSKGDRYVMVFNGEIYNHSDLKIEIEKESENGTSLAWKGHSDTETLLACFSQWGVKKTLERVVGMFAIALWDRLSDSFIWRETGLARSRFTMDG